MRHISEIIPEAISDIEGKIELNKIYNESNLVTMLRMPDNFIDLTVTSPPYDNLRDYKGFKFHFKHIARHLYRVTKQGGVLVWVVNDATINGSETGTSFKQALFFMECGFRLHDTMIYKKDSITFPEVNRYNPIFEYMFVFSKGKPKTTNILKDRKNLHPTKVFNNCGREADGTLIKKINGNKAKSNGARYNVWQYGIGYGKTSLDSISFEHPATFPEALAADHIKSWSNELDLVYDCFGGSGTTAKMAHLLKRNWILSEMSEEYCHIAEKRLKPYLQQTQLF